MARYGNFAGPLDPKNIYYGTLNAAVEALNKAQDDFYKSRKEAYEELDYDTFPDNKGQVEKKFDDLMDPLKPWDWKSTFDSLSLTRKTGDTHIQPPLVDPQPSYRFVKDSFPLAGISGGYVQDVFPWTVKRYGSTVTDVLAYHFNRGKRSVDPLYGGLKAFKTAGKELPGYTYTVTVFDGEGNPFDFTSPLQVWDSFGQVPEAWNSTTSYNSRKLGVMDVNGQKYEDMVREAINEYDNALALYVSYSGGELIDDTFTGVGEEPWDGYKGKDISYNQPQGLPEDFVRQVRGI
jgi:hypothetical protein